jgi:transcriptional regulator with XRE-family HTH domain
MNQAPRFSAHDELVRAKLELAAARERGEAGALQTVLAHYPRHTAALIEFSAALAATSAYASETPTRETQRVAALARAGAFEVVFGGVGAPAAAPAVRAGAQVVGPAQAVASLKALRQTRKVTLRSAAERLGLGVDVLSALEAGRIRVLSVPDRLLRALSDLLDATAEQIGALLEPQAAVTPALRRARTGETKASEDAVSPTQLDFAEAVRLSPEMTGEQKASWLDAARDASPDA